MTATAGRPRDPDVDRRVVRAALDLFGDAGWSGFSIDEVARRAHVGKPSIYRRWSTAADLLVDAVRETVHLVPPPDGEDLVADLSALAHHLLDAHLPDAGRAMLRLRFEAPSIPELRDHWEAIRTSQVDAARRLVHRAVRRGELPRGTNVTLVLDTLCGAAMMHAIARPDDAAPPTRRELDRYVEELVAFVLAGISAG
ncbi:TetR/AcrR family transcriptional regulator [Nocardioides marmoriginsengisoli]|uniref:TetR/AcrR family transcriptional regulator n=1 Tax=Nocardioides marmoriginsengisoli TaxID=661483 RepID=A0A3N0CC97_9ACTN|nr:TetR/AcrR family transcriptional regulator [Nocardioides marmoriginsengisoli]RNL61072.1 TetR/AcrR family transcriptional regulator [Nocardioides marmoriginsengisoli]